MKTTKPSISKTVTIIRASILSIWQWPTVYCLVRFQGGETIITIGKEWNFRLSVISPSSALRMRVRACAPGTSLLLGVWGMCVWAVGAEGESQHAPRSTWSTWAAAGGLARSRGCKFSLLFGNSPRPTPRPEKCRESEVCLRQVIPGPHCPPTRLHHGTDPSS